MRDIIEKLALLTAAARINEAEVKPGEKKEISFQLKKLDKLSTDLNAYQQSVYQMQNTKLPPSMQEEMNALQEKLKVEVIKVQKAYDDMYVKSIIDDKPVKMNNMFAGLQKHCKQIIKVYKELNNDKFTKQLFLYRGIRSREDAVYGKPFEKRKPKDSASDLDDLLNTSMKDMGFEARRDNSMFVTGAKGHASGYGYDVYIMFPVDGFTYTWSKTTADLILDNGKRIDLLDQTALNYVRETIEQAALDNPEVKEIFPYPSSLFTQGYNFQNDVAQVKNAVARKLLPKELAEAVDNLITNDSIQEHFQFTDEGLFEAITSRKEIYMLGSYYAVNSKYMEKLISFLQKADVDSVELPESFGEAPDTFDEGDIVMVTDGPHKDQIGTITYVNNQSSYDVSFSTSSTTTLNSSQIQQYKLPDGSTPEFNTDDEVQVINSNSPYYGKIGKINYMWSSTGKFEITFQDGDRRDLYKSELQKYDPATAITIPTVPVPTGKSEEIKVYDEVVVVDKNSPYYAKTGKVNFIYSSGKIEVPIEGSYIDFKPEQLKLDTPVTGTTDFNVGDTVTIMAGDHHGYYGTITDVINSEKGGAADVALTGMNQTVSVPTASLKLDTPKATQKATPEEKTFKVGDVVKINNNSLSPSYVGQVGKVIYVYGSYPEVTVRFDTGAEKDFKNTMVDKIIAPVATFKAGDKVKINSVDMFNGKTGTITAGPDADGEYDVDFDDSPGPEYYKAELLSKIEAPKAEKKIFAVGDQVKITSVENKHHDQVGEVTYAYSTLPEVEVTFSDGTREDFNLKNVDHVSASPATTTSPLSSGTTVKITDEKSTEYDKIATILSGPDADQEYLLHFIKSSTEGYFDSTQFDVVEEEATSESDIKIGDTVKVVEKQSSFYGEQGEVIDTGFNPDGDPWLKVATSINPSGWKTLTSFVEKIEPTTKATEMDLTKLSPEKAIQHLKNDQKVQVMSGEWKDKVGKVTYVFPSFEEIEVTFDDGQVDQDIPANIVKILSSVPAKSAEPSPAPESASGFKVGDKVQINDPNRTDYGRIGTLDNYFANGSFEGKFSIAYDDETGGIVRPDQITKVEEEDQQPEGKQTFAVGDRVEVVSTYPSLIGKKGTITQVNPLYDFVSVEMDDNDKSSSFPNSALKKIEQQESAPEFKKNDHVEIIKNDSTLKGKTGKIQSFPHGGWVSIQLDNNDSMVSGLKLTDIKKIEKTNTTNPYDIKVNDRVEVVSAAPASFIGKTGIVTTAHEYGVGVKLDGYATSLPMSFSYSALKKLDQTPTPQEFHIGDRIEVINPELSSFGAKGKITDSDVTMLVVKVDGDDVIFVKKSSVKKIG